MIYEFVIPVFVQVETPEEMTIATKNRYLRSTLWKINFTFIIR